MSGNMFTYSCIRYYDSFNYIDIIQNIQYRIELQDDYRK